ncbi:hypothetical protein HJFPF1_05596 [Paramyrothecium foliicola]|nr:hypothetical protein HJFPF1_05596 [Paramyrothecium foliicola]
MASDAAWHFFKNAALILLSFAFFPLNISVVLIAEAWCFARSFIYGRAEARAADGKTILVTGVGMSKGLTLARLFHRQGHRVVGADFHSFAIGQVSKAVSRYYALPHPLPIEGDEDEDPYIDNLLSIIKRENVDLWISVSDVNAAIHDALAKDLVETKTNAKAVQFGRKEVQLLHEKDSFMEHTRDIGLQIPETEIVNDKDGIIAFLRKRGGLQAGKDGKQYIVKPIGVDDIARFDMPLLPLPTEAATLQRITSIPFKNTAKGPHYIVQEFISGQELCTHALVVRGKVRAFTCCPSSGLLMHYTALPTESPLSQLMLDFTRRQAEVHGDDFTGHMSFDFLARREGGGGSKDDLQIYPIECNPRVHTAIVLFNDTPELVDQYFRVLSPSSTDSSDSLLVPNKPQRYYWIGQDLVELVLYPLYKMMFSSTVRFSDLRQSTSRFLDHVLHWKDGTFEVWDPWPFFWLYHVQWPILFAQYLIKGRWSNLNVSTGKAFQA